MKHTYTQLLMRYLYYETEPTENQAIEAALNINSKLRAEFESYVEVKILLDELKIVAPQSLVDEVLKFNKDISLESAY
jgi:hypothetical protein